MILITEKDADFVANIARRELESIKKNIESTIKEVDKEKEVLERTIPLLESEELRNEYTDKFNRLYSFIKNNLAAQFFPVVKDFTRIIELMTTGSVILEDSND